MQIEKKIMKLITLLEISSFLVKAEPSLMPLIKSDAKLVDLGLFFCKYFSIPAVSETVKNDK